MIDDLHEHVAPRRTLQRISRLKLAEPRVRMEQEAFEREALGVLTEFVAGGVADQDVELEPRRRRVTLLLERRTQRGRRFPRAIVLASSWAMSSA